MTSTQSFFESFEFPVTVPGDALLTVESWDYDGIGDDLIGSTTVDIENRWFTTDWRALSKVPVEYRDIFCPGRSTKQGTLKMFIEIVDPEMAKKSPLRDITPPPPKEFELRAIAWTVKDCPPYNSYTSMSDLMVKGHCTSTGTTQSTDVHYRTKTGTGNFNWRMQWPVVLPTPIWPRLSMHIWDKEILCPNVAIGETVIPLKRLCARALVTGKRTYYTVDGERDFWLNDLKIPKETKEQKKGLPKIKLRIELLPKAKLSNRKAGPGRGEPNMFPFLPPPEGRMPAFDIMHPWNMFFDILGPTASKKICCALFIATLIACLAYFIPMWVSAEISEAAFSGGE